ncbi:hypothetical protein EAE96_003748 [Botrytis aclada]|nr:hypothetical protein EAE96_003748 [Botrytis aclada]
MYLTDVIIFKNFLSGHLAEVDPWSMKGIVEICSVEDEILLLPGSLGEDHLGGRSMLSDGEPLRILYLPSLDIEIELYMY